MTRLRDASIKLCKIVRPLSAKNYTREIFWFVIHWSIFKTLARYRTSLIALHWEIDIAYTLDTILHFIDHNSIYKIGRIEVSQWIRLLLAQLNFSREIPKSMSRKPFSRHASSGTIMCALVANCVISWHTMEFLRFAFGAYIYKARGKYSRFNGPTYIKNILKRIESRMSALVSSFRIIFFKFLKKWISTTIAPKFSYFTFYE